VKFKEFTLKFKNKKERNYIKFIKFEILPQSFNARRQISHCDRFLRFCLWDVSYNFYAL